MRRASPAIGPSPSSTPSSRPSPRPSSPGGGPASSSSRATYVEPPALGEPPPPILITLPDSSTRRSNDEDMDQAALSAALGCPVRLVSGVHDHTMPYQATDAEGSVVATEKAGSIGRLGPPDRFFDLFSLHLLTTSTLEHLREAEPDADFDERRFPPQPRARPGHAPASPRTTGWARCSTSNASASSWSAELAAA